MSVVNWATYGTFVLFAALVVIAPGPDFAVVVKNSLARGRSAGIFTTLGVTTSCAVQGTLAAFGVGVILARSQTLFLAIRWVGVAYLCYLGVQALVAARRGQHWTTAEQSAIAAHPRRLAAWRQGFLSNITNPKVLAFYLSVLPQFLGHAGTATIDALALAYTHAALGVIWLTALVAFLHRVRPWIQRRRVRRTLDAVTGTALIGFASALALESR
jgi:RhtB (resistance to homoserine/threonine) family protein